MNFFPKFGQIACCFGQDCRNNKFLLMFEKNFLRFRKKSGFYVFFLDYNFAQNVPLDTHNNVLKTLSLSWCQNSRVCRSRKKKIQKITVIKWYFRPKVGQVACCFWQDCRNNKFLLMFEKIFRRVRKKSRCYIFFHKKIFRRMFLWPHQKTFLKPSRYHGAQIQEFVAPKPQKIPKKSL